MKSLLITGGAGFIGSNYIEYCSDKNEEYYIVNLDKLTYAGNERNVNNEIIKGRYTFIRGDICNRELVEHIFRQWDIRGVIHFAAESHVDNSINSPDIFIQTNVHGTFTLLDVAKNYWLKKPFKYRENYDGCRFLHISTDEVYGSLGKTGKFTEKTSYAPNSPYSASKAGSDMLVRAYYQTYGLNTVITNCSNNYGPKQHKEKLIPTIIGKALAHKYIPIYGDGLNIRDWLYVQDHCGGIDTAFHKGASGETYNIGGNTEKTNIEIAKTICDQLQILRPNGDGRKYHDLISFVEDRPGHDRRYAVDCSKITRELGWLPEISFETGIELTIQWYIDQINHSKDTPAGC